MNWGYKILTVIILFIVVMLTMVFIAMKQDNDLIEDNYYEKELAYQSQIDAGRRLDWLHSGKLLHPTANNILLQLPTGSYENGVNGSIEFLRIDDAAKDIRIKLEPDNDGKQIISRESFSTGTYQVRIKWKHASEEFYQQEDMLLPK